MAPADNTVFQLACGRARRKLPGMTTAESTKLCPGCNKAKPHTTEFFHRNGRQPLRTLCKVCVSGVMRRRYQANPNKFRARAALFRADKEHVRELQTRRERRYTECNQQRTAVSVESYKRCPACGETKPLSAEFFHRHRARKSGYWPSCKVCNRARIQRWRARNPTIVRQGHARQNGKRATNLQKRIHNRAGILVRDTLQRGEKGGRSWPALLGFTVADLMRHLERQFSARMSWDNYGKWHIDHILPVTSFEFHSTDCPDFKACWALTNLRPLWAKANLSKGSKRQHLI